MYLNVELELIRQVQAWIPSLDWLMHAVTEIGYGKFYYFCGALIFWTVSRRLGFRLLFLSAFSWSLNCLLKLGFHAPRPFWVDSSVFNGVSHGGYGLPSGHAQSAVVFWGLLAQDGRRKFIWAGCGIMIFLIGLSRIYLGVHFPNQVIVGWVIGLCLVIACLFFEARFFQWFSSRRKLTQAMIPLLISGGIIGMGFLIRWIFQDWTTPEMWITNAPDTFKPWRLANPFSVYSPVIAGSQVAGILLGCVAGRHFISLDGQRTWGKIFIKAALGMLVLGGIYWLAKYRINVPQEWNFIILVYRYILSLAGGFWITGGAPLLFHKLGLEE